MFRSLKLRKLINSISKEDFEAFDVELLRSLKKNEDVKKFYSKLTGHLIPDSVFFAGIVIQDINVQHTGNSINSDTCITIGEIMYDMYNNRVDKKTNVTITVDDDIREILYKYGDRLMYYKAKDDIKYTLMYSIFKYLSDKELEYGVCLDTKTEQELAKLIKSFSVTE